jgi:hypothetical protein
MTAPCRHGGYHSGQGRYDHETGRLRYVVICDDCKAELREVTAIEYRPHYNTNGNDRYPHAA